MILTEAKEELSRKLDISYTDIANNGLFTDTDLAEWLWQAILRVWDHKPWDFTEGAKSVATENTEYYDYPNDFMLGSIFQLMIGGKTYRKMQFRDYLLFKETNPTANDKVYAEYNGFVFVNQNSYTIGDTMDLFGKLKATKLTGGSELLPFGQATDDNEHSGNEAIVTLAYALALDSEKKKNPAQAQVEEKKAYFILDTLWKPFADSRSWQQTDIQMFDVPDMFGRAGNANNIGNFN